MRINYAIAAIAIFTVTSLLAACNQTRPIANNFSSQVQQPATQTPANSAPSKTTKAKTQTGSASYISASFQGKKTASGTIYNQNQLVAAHPSYPFGTLVRVINLQNGRTVKVRVVDRSATQAKTKHVIDLSQAAAKQLAFTKQGQVEVKTEVISWGSKAQ